jgi:DNA-binding LacI/PurR family transcriptional regulator
MRGAAGASAETRERVMQVAADLGYRPDARARLLARGSSRLLGVVFGVTGTFHLEFLDGLYSTAEDAGYDLILSALTPSRDERLAVETLLDFRCEGVILLGPEMDVPVLAGRLPVVVVGWEVDDPAVDVVRTSDDEGMRAAVGHLVTLGHRKIVHVDGGSRPVARARRRGYHAAMRDHGLDAYAQVVRGGFRQEHGAGAARALLDEGSLPTAVVAYNDDVAAGLVESFYRAGVAVPSDVSIVGWDDSSLSRLPYLDLTTVRQDIERMTRLAVQRSAARIVGQEIAERELVLPPQLVVRSSTGPAPSR